MDGENNILENTQTGMILNVKVVPNSSINKLVDYTNDYIRIKLSAPAIENRANRELIEFCAKLFRINKSEISIVTGEKSKIKKLLIKNENYQEVSKKLLFVLESLQK